MLVLEAASPIGEYRKKTEEVLRLDRASLCCSRGQIRIPAQTLHLREIPCGIAFDPVHLTSGLNTESMLSGAIVRLLNSRSEPFQIFVLSQINQQSLRDFCLRVEDLVATH